MTLVPSTSRGGASIFIRDEIGWYTPEQFGAVGDGVSDDAVALNAMYAAAAAIGGVVYLGRNKTYGTSTPVNCHGTAPATALPVVTRVAGLESVARIKPLNDIAGPVLNCAPTTAAASPSWEFEGVYVDCSLAASAAGLYVNNVQRLNVDRCLFRAGAIGLEIGAVSAGNYSRLTSYNQTTAGYQYDAGTTTNSQGHNWYGCNFFMSTGAAADCNAGWLDLSGHQDQFYSSCRVQRSPGINFKLPYGWKLDGSAAAAAAASFFSLCNVDSITDGAAAGTGVGGAGIWLNKILNARLSQCWVSSLDAGKGWREPSLYVDQCTSLDVENCYLSGRGVFFGNTAVTDRPRFRGNTFPNVNTADPCFTFGAAQPTNMLVRDNVKLQAAAKWFDSDAVAQLAMVAPGQVL